MNNFAIFIISALSTLIVAPYIYSMLLKGNCVATNYKEEKIPIGMGLIFILVQFVVVLISSFYINVDNSSILSYISIVSLIGLIGIIDDLIGESTVKGFKGHIKSLFQGKLTTGGLKALVGFLSSIIFSLLISSNYIDMLINIFLIPLFINLINLFDLRPGRAGKAFLTLSIVLLITASISKYNFIIYSAIGIVIVYMKYDLKAKSMLGDIGSNSLGATLGMYCVLTNDISIKVIYLIVLILLHIIAEFYSFSKIIDKYKILKYLDNLGR